MPNEPSFTPEMSLLDAVSLHRATETVFRSYDASAGVCLLCTHLFDTIGDVAQRYQLDLAVLLRQLEEAAATPQKDGSPSR